MGGISTTMTGQSLAHYRLLEKLGSGGMGEVYLAEDSRLDRTVALKLLPPEMAANPERLKRFQREVRILASLNHPNITTIHSVEKAGVVRFFTMEVVQGEVLAQIIRPTGVSLARFFKLAIPLVDAVSAAHAQKITHRDLKPGNVMVSREGRVKVLDFGLAKIRKRSWESTGDQTRLGRPLVEEACSESAATDEGVLTEEGRILGTGPYMSPEQVRGRVADARSDVFSLGILLYEMLTGRRPFQGKTQMDLLSSILRDAPDFESQGTELPDQLSRIIHRCLEKDPGDRYQQAGELYEELLGLKKELEIKELLKSSSPSGEVARQILDSTAHQEPVGLKGPRLIFPVLVGLLVLMVAGGLLSTWMVARTSSPAGPEAASKDSRPSIAVLYFDNMSGDADLDWLRMGLTDMLVTDLSRSPELEVLSTNRLYRLMKDLGHPEEPFADWEDIQRLTLAADVHLVLVGSFAQAGDRLQIDIKIQETDSGRIVVADRREGTGSESVFSIVDQLSRGIRREFEISGADAPSPEPFSTEFASSSVEAYRYYSTAKRLHLESKEEEAISLYEKAIELDPDFAQALVALSTLHANLGHQREAREYARQALENPDRLPPVRRYFAEGKYYGASWATYDRAVEAFEKAVELFPNHQPSRSQLAGLYVSLERYDAAIEQYEKLIALNNSYAPNHYMSALAYSALGDFDRGQYLLE